MEYYIRPDAHSRAPRCTNTARSLLASDLQLAPKLDDAIGRQLEELHGALAALQHPGEKLFAPQRHSSMALRRNQLLAAQEEAGAHHVERRSAGFDTGQVHGNIDLVHEAVVEHDPIESLPRVLQLQALVGRNMR